MKKYELLKVDGLTYVLTKRVRTVKDAIQPDFKGTKLAVCGILINGETLEGWHRRMIESEPRRAKSVTAFNYQIRKLSEKKRDEKLKDKTE